jgi:hypothetical protein
MGLAASSPSKGGGQQIEVAANPTFRELLSMEPFILLE